MIIPIRCFTCGKVLADKYEYYSKKVDELERQAKVQKDQQVDTDGAFEGVKTGKILDELGLKRMCCRRHMIGHVDLSEII